MRGSAVFRTGVAPGGALAPRWTQNVLWRSAKVVPSLDLRFAESKSLTDAASGQSLVTFTRASSGTYVGSDGVLKTATNDAPRFDHNPTTGESLGLLVEEQRTNLLVQSENLGTTWIFTSASASTNTATAPDGQTSADTLIPSNGIANGLCRQDVAGLPDSTTYTLTVFLKSAGLNTASLQFYNKANTFHGTRIIDLTNGTLSGSDFVGVSSVVAYPNGWYRLIFTGLGSGTGVTTPNIRIICTATGNGTSGIYVWGAQLEAGSFPTSYIPTTTATATRSADVASITGTNFSSWYRQDEGTVFAETQLPAGTAVNTSSRSIVDATDGSTNNRVNLRAIASATNTDQLTIRSGAVTVAQFASAGTNVSTTARKIAAVYKLDDYAAWATGATSAATDTSGAIPVGVNQITVGSAVGGSEFMSGTIRRLCYWPARLANTTLQAITQ